MKLQDHATLISRGIALCFALTILGGCGAAAGVDDEGFCAQEERVEAGACVACAPGTINPAGDSTAGPSTMCEPVLCAQDERVEGNACVACAEGSTNAAGDDASGADTLCDDACMGVFLSLGGCVSEPDDMEEFCAQDERVEAGACVACAPGTINPAGDSTAGPSTLCEPVLCAQDERVEGNACVACAEGLINAAGDDASGADTLCGDACMDALGIPCDRFEEAYIKPSTSRARMLFGFDIALDGDTLAVTSVYESSNATGIDGDQSNISALDSGAVYVFARREDTWFQQAYIKASNTDPGDVLGQSVALDGDTLVVGATFEASGATGVDGDQRSNASPVSGAVYVYERANGVWAQQAYIKASNTGAQDRFGFSVALDGDTLVVGASEEDSSATGIDGDQSSDAAEGSGAVYVFTRAGTTWSQQAYIKASNPGAGDRFGWTLELDGDTLVVGAPEEDSSATGIDGDQSSDAAEGSGAVYVFTRAGTTWSQQAYIKASNTGVFDFFGADVALSGDTLVIGAPYEGSEARGVGGAQSNDRALNSGAVYVFERSQGVWAQQTYIKASNTGAGDFFGASLDFDGTRLAVGAAGESSNATGVGGEQASDDMMESGAVYLFERVGSSWVQQAYIKASNTDPRDGFGWKVKLSEGLLAISARHEASDAEGVDGDQSDNSADETGAVYVRRLDP